MTSKKPPSVLESLKRSRGGFQKIPFREYNVVYGAAFQNAKAALLALPANANFGERTIDDLMANLSNAPVDGMSSSHKVAENQLNRIAQTVAQTCVFEGEDVPGAEKVASELRELNRVLLNRSFSSISEDEIGDLSRTLIRNAEMASQKAYAIHEKEGRPR